jgi:AmpD protein
MSGRPARADRCRVGPDGWVPGARALHSSHRDARPPGVAIELLVVHCISLPPGRFGGGHIERFFTGALDASEHPYFERLHGVRVSSHFLLARDGSLTQFVSCLDRAWHAGASDWEGRAACNDFSIGIELEGSEFEPFTCPQYEALSALQRGLRAAYPIRATRGHSEIAPGRKTDPGPLFDWSRVVRDY